MWGVTVATSVWTDPTVTAPRAPRLTAGGVPALTVTDAAADAVTLPKLSVATAVTA